MKTVSKQELLESVGKTLQTTDWYSVNQEQIDLFAEVTHDYQFIHVDPKRAAQTPFGSTIAHGFLTLSLLSHFAETFILLVEDLQMAVNYGFDKVRFIAPVKVDSRIRAHARLLDVTEKNPGQFMLKTEVTVEIEGEEKPALLAEWLTMQVAG
ncbi:Acyl dehydratase [Microbulbifer donghaiensis]|uniref:Acyl dehydratase n=1 Tax=Microbulbifer donghaiensis TaxID=494016 RepID=A0A1M5IE91_9GAMM|nr:MaoC family dehydratase [Microbulbifer donghaiensis]SHG26664.1 Acyl dehydratase [Microbulbifer donghaiensis]